MTKLFILALLLPSLFSLVFAAGLAARKDAGWGWFLVVAFLLGLAAINGGTQ